MIILDNTNRSLEVKLSGSVSTNELPVVASFADITTSDIVPASSNTQTNGTTAVTVVAAPGSSTQRQVKFISVRNADTTTATVILQYNDNSTIRTILKIALDVDDTLVYNDGEGFRVMDDSGSIKQTGGGGAVSNAFSSVEVSGQSTIVADTPTDTLTFVAGTGVTITTNATTDSVTFASSVADGDKGDIAVSSSGATWTIDNDVVTFAKMQNIATDRLVGRDTASSGDPEELTVGGGLEFTGSGGIQRSALTGDVTASAGSNSTTIANSAVTLAKMQNINGGRLLGRSTGASGVVEELTISVGLYCNASAIGVDFAGQSDMESEASAKAVEPLAMKWHPGVFKGSAVVTCSAGTYTLQTSTGVVSSITKNATGKVTVNFSSNFSSVDKYTVSCIAGLNTAGTQYLISPKGS